MRAELRQPNNSVQHAKVLPQRAGLLVLVFFLIGIGLRVANLDLKTAWMDEVSTVIFSLGNSSFYLPLEQLVDLDAVLKPITVNGLATPLDSARYLLQENNHPPAYFMLAHLWTDLFSQDGAIASLATARLFSALLGSLAIPVVFWAAKITFQSPLAGLMSAAFMAVSPFSLFLSQEARHYGLAITLITISLGCFAIAARALFAQRALHWAIGLLWLCVNAFAFSNHYFSALTFTAEGIVLAAIALQQARQQGFSLLLKSYLWPIYGVAVGTALSIFAWLPVLLNFHGSPQTTFLRDSDFLMRWINPVLQTLGAAITSFVTPANFFAQKPVDFLIIGLSILLTLVFLIIFIPAMIRGGKQLNRYAQGHLGLMIMGGFVVAMLGIFAFVCYVYGSDITRGLRYKFTYYPALMIIAGGIFAQYWQSRSPNTQPSVAIPFRQQRLSGQRFVQISWLVGLTSAGLIVCNLAFPKYYAPDRFIPFIQGHSEHPIVLASTEKIFEEPTVIGAKFLSIAWEIQRNFPIDDPDGGWKAAPQFFSLRQGHGVDLPIAESFANIAAQFTEPVDVWIVRSRLDEQDPLIVSMPETCLLAQDEPQGNKGGYLYIHFQCGI